MRVHHIHEDTYGLQAPHHLDVDHFRSFFGDITSALHAISPYHALSQMAISIQANTITANRSWYIFVSPPNV
jgi:hypothetical protein